MHFIIIIFILALMYYGFIDWVRWARRTRTRSRTVLALLIGGTLWFGVWSHYHFQWDEHYQRYSYEANPR